MSVEIYNNIHPKIAKHIDERFKTVAAVTALPDPTIATNFIYEGAIAYVAGTVKKYYKCVMNSTNTALEWQPFNPDELVIGVINIIPGTTVLDLSMVSPVIAKCYAVKINIVGGTSATIQAITNFPGSDKLITFTVTAGQQVTFKHNDYDVATTGQIVLEVGFDITIKGRLIGDESLTLKQHGVALCQWDATQFMKPTEWAQNLLSIAVADNLTTTSITTALSANQGVILNNKINTKQDQLIAGEKIQLIPGTNNATINALVRDWSQVILTTSPSFSVQTAIYLAAQGISTSTEHLYADLRSLPSQAGGNRGMWMCPPKKDPSVASNWIMIDGPTRSTSHVQYNYTYDTDPSTGLISNMYYPRINTASQVGDNLDLDFNPDGPATEKVSCAFNKVGLYHLVFDITMLIAGTVPLRNYIGRINVTNGVQLSTNPINGGNYKKYIPAIHPDASIADKYVHLHTEFTIEVLTVGSNNGFTFNINETTGNNWTGVSLLTQNTLQITKIR